MNVQQSPCAIAVLGNGWFAMVALGQCSGRTWERQGEGWREEFRDVQLVCIPGPPFYCKLGLDNQSKLFLSVI